MGVSSAAFTDIARQMLGLPTGGRKLSIESERRHFRGNFGVSFRVISKLWNKLDPKTTISLRAEPKHLLWTMVYLKVHKSEPMHLRITGCKSRVTYQNWVDQFTSAIEDLTDGMIDFSNRFKEWDGLA